MKEVKIKNSSNDKYRYRIMRRQDGLFQVFCEEWYDASQSDYALSTWGEIDDNTHLSDSIDNAIEIGESFLKKPKEFESK